jgi:regulator of protease activity HflC (stomatin/prohibitin superfamily)
MQVIDQLRRRWGLIAVTLLSINLAGCFGCSFVPPGYVGIKINLYGSQRGVQDIPIVTGRVIFNPITTQIEAFPTFLQYRVWTKSLEEGKAADESITFVSSDRIPINVDVSAAYQFMPDKVPELYIKFRSDPDTIADTYIRSRIRDAFIRSGSQLKAMDIVGGSISQLDADVKDDVDKEMQPIGIRFDYVSVLNKPRIPEAIQNAIEAAIESTQRAQQATNQVAVKKAEADQAVAVATGEANAVRAKANGDADALLARQTAEAKAILLKKEAEAQGNAELAKSVTPELVQYMTVKQWKGNLPTWMTGSGGGAVPFINMQPPANK